MGTRGKYGFYYKQKYYLFYNQFDSYPEGLGNILLLQIKTLIKWCIDNNVNFYEYIGQKIETAKIVTDEDEPTDEDKQKLYFSTNLNYLLKIIAIGIV